jgi:hypothetical protein
MAIKIGNKIVQSDGGGYQPQGVPDTPSQQQQNQYQQAFDTMKEAGITSLSGTTGGVQGQQAAQQQQDQGYQTIQQQAQEANQLDQMLQDMRLTKEEEEKKSLAQKGKDIAQGIMTNLMGGGEGGNLNLTKEEAYANLPAGMHPLRKQYEYLKEKYGPNWANTTQAKVLEGYLSGVPVERGGGLGARDEGYGGGNFTLDPESTEFQEAEAYRKQLLNNLGLAGQDYEGQFMGSVGDQLGGIDIELARRGLSPEQFFNFNQQLMAADPSAENQAYKAARPFSSGAGLSTLFEKFAPLPLKAVAGMFPERDLSGFENYADYEKAGAAFRPLPVVEQSNMQDMSRPIRPGYKFPDAEAGLPTPVYPRYPLPGDPKRPPFGPPFMPDGGNFPLPVGINAFNPMFLGPSFRGSPYTNRGVSPAFYEALKRFA